MYTISEFMKNAPHKNDIDTVKHKDIYYNCPCSLDIETTSYINENGDKRAIMYIWQMCIFGVCVYGRTYAEMITLFNILKRAYCAEGEKIIVYVHNLSYDSHFILKWLNVTNMFATEAHEPLYFEHDNFLIFKCSLRLSGKKLANLADKKQKISNKIKGFDYSKIRHPGTKLTEDELLYCEYDIKIVYEYIKYEMSLNHNDITMIPYTKTGYPRRYCRNKCDFMSYRKWFENTTITDEQLYLMFRQAFTGGITHAGAIHCNMQLSDITNYDLQSDYPSQIVKNKFPMTPFRHVKLKQFPDDEETAVIAIVNFKNLRAKYHHSTLSISKCKFNCPYIHDSKIQSCFLEFMKKRKKMKKCPFDNMDLCTERLELDNGRIVRAGNVTTVITEVDFYNISLMYDFTEYTIIDSYIAEKDYLPREFVLATLKLYQDKTILKGTDKDVEYKLAKAMLNALYGCCVSDIVHPSIIYNPDGADMWTEQKPEDITEELLKYKNNKKSFLIYQTGVYITAFARRDLIETISKICEATKDTLNGKPFDDIVYYDTDSIKILNGEKYKGIFVKFNLANEQKMQAAAKHFNIKPEMYAPKDYKNRVQVLGKFDREEPYKYFKTLGAKRYIYIYPDIPRKVRYKELKDKLYIPKYIQSYKKYRISYTWSSTFHITIAGVNKITGARYMQELAYKQKISVFDIFTDELYFPPGKCGKKTVQYFDNGFTEIVSDYQGNDYICTEKSFIYMCDSDYSLGIAGDFMNLITKSKSWGL